MFICLLFHHILCHNQVFLQLFENILLVPYVVVIVIFSTLGAHRENIQNIKLNHIFFPYI
jgi:hypothetical protein